MFGLLSSLDSSKWHDSDTPPTKKDEIDGGTYMRYGVMSDAQRDGYWEYVLVPDKGDPCKGKLYSACSNPLRGVSTCWFSIGKGNIIKGMTMDDDWVIMNDDYLAELEDAVVESDEVPDRGLYFDLKTDQWSRKGDPPGGKAKLGYNDYDISAVVLVAPGEIQVSLESHPPGMSKVVKMMEVERNCFRSTPYCFLKVIGGEIRGVMTKTDWYIKNRR